MVEVQSGPRASRTRARYALFLEADERAARPLREQQAAMETWIRAILRGIGGDAAQARAPLLMATADGLLLHRVSVDPRAPIADTIACAVDAALAALGSGGDERASPTSPR